MSKKKEGFVYNRYCCCIVEGNLDCMTFPNPDKESNAIQKCGKRSMLLNEMGKRSYPVVITQIIPNKDGGWKIPKTKEGA